MLKVGMRTAGVGISSMKRMCERIVARAAGASGVKRGDTTSSRYSMMTAESITIAVDSTQGHGARFFFTLPLVRA